MKKRGSRNVPQSRWCFRWVIKVSRHFPGRQRAKGDSGMKTQRQRFEKQSGVGRAGQQILHVNVAESIWMALQERQEQRLGRYVRGYATMPCSSKYIALRLKRPTFVSQPLHSQLCDFWRSFHFLRFKFPLHLWHGNNKYFPWLMCEKYDNDSTDIQWTAKQYTDTGYYFYGYTCVIVTMGIKAEQPAFALPSRTKWCYCFPED